MPQTNARIMTSATDHDSYLGNDEKSRLFSHDFLAATNIDSSTTAPSPGFPPSRRNQSNPRHHRLNPTSTSLSSFPSSSLLSSLLSSSPHRTFKSHFYSFPSSCCRRFKMSTTASSSQPSFTLLLVAIIVSLVVVFLPTPVGSSEPLIVNVASDPRTHVKLPLLPATDDRPFTFIFAFKTCRNVDIVRFKSIGDSSLIGTITLRDSRLGFCMPKRCENSEVKFDLNEWHIVRLSPYGTDNSQLLFQIFRPDGAFRPLVVSEYRILSFPNTFQLASATTAFYAEILPSFRGCFSPSLGFDLSKIATLPLVRRGSCFMDDARYGHRSYAGECNINVTCSDGNFCRSCKVDSVNEKNTCTCEHPYRDDVSQQQQSDSEIHTCVLGVSSLSPCRNNPCRFGGTCVPSILPGTNETTFQCICPALYTGTYCDTPVDPCRPNPCLNRGVCIKNATTNQATCQCHGTGFKGPVCEHDIDECSSPDVTPCAPSNSHRCYNLPGTYWCSCKTGYTNQTCADPVDPCDRSKCQNGAICVPLWPPPTRSIGNTAPSVSGYVCTCPPGFGGVYCEISYSKCNNFTCPFPNSVCFSSITGNTTCMCQSREYQPSRDRNLCYATDPCASMPCSQGTCRPVDPFISTQFTCECPSGYTGERCETMIDNCQLNPGSCQNGGTCIPSVGSFSCSCPEGFEPPYCEPIDYCALGVCELNGSQSMGCIKKLPGYDCRCKPGWTGPICTVPIDACANEPCKNGGLCQVTKPGSYKCVCPVGYSGKQCEELPETPVCETYKCLNGGECRPGYGPYEVCICKPGFIGLVCESTDPCYPNPCGLNGQCYEDAVYSSLLTLQDSKMSYKCKCHDGWQGHNCTIRDPTPSIISRCTDDTYCEPGGRCVNGVCVCRKVSFELSTPFNSTIPARTIDVGWKGPRCKQPIVPDPCAEYPPICKNGARCTRHDPQNSLGFFCSCGRVMSSPDFQYTGGRCEEIMGQYCHGSMCQNGGTCIPSGSKATCLCSSGFTGRNCEQSMSICQSKGGMSPCLNGGTCVPGRDPTNFTCTCSPAFSGRFCEARKDLCIPNPCQNDGQCLMKRILGNNEAAYSCNCSHTGYTGRNCETPLDKCYASLCQNGGTCLQIGGQVNCRCPEGYAGVRCQISLNPCSIEPSPCQHGSTCVRPNPTQSPLAYSCICPPGLTGMFCEQEINHCSGITCHHGGRCVKNDNSFLCVCPPGFTGTYCEMDIDECKLFSPCAQSGAPCRNTMGSYECDCRALSSSWVDGKNCTVPLTGCNGNNFCRNGGTCTPVLVDENRNVHDFYCLCPLSWTGTFCEVANVVSLHGNASMTYRKEVQDLPITVTFDLRTTIADGPLFDILLRDKNVGVVAATPPSQVLVSLYLLRGYLRGHLLDESKQFAFAYSVTNDDWTSVQLTISAEGVAILKVAQSTCDFPYCQFNLNASSNNGLLNQQSEQVLQFAFGSRHVPSGNGFIGCLRNITINSAHIIDSPATFAQNIHIGCRQDGLCSSDSSTSSQTCNGNGKCLDRWIRTECECNPGFDGETCSLHLPKYTLGYFNGEAKHIELLPTSMVTFPVKFVMAFRTSPSIDKAIPVLLISFTSRSNSSSQVGFLWSISNDKLFVNGDSKDFAVLPGNQHILSISIVNDGNMNALIKAYLNDTIVMTHTLSSAVANLKSVVIGKQQVIRVKSTGSDASTEGFFIADMIEVDGNRLSLSSKSLGAFMVDASKAYASEYIPLVCNTRPCANGGMCKNSLATGYECQCVKGFSGPNCTEQQPCDYVTCPSPMSCIAKASNQAYCASPISLDGFREFVEFSTKKSAYLFDSQVLPFKINFTFRTKQLNGLLVFAIAEKTSRFVLVELVDGDVVMSHNILQQGTDKDEDTGVSEAVVDGSWKKFELKTVETASGSELRLNILQPSDAGVDQMLSSLSLPFTARPAFYASTEFSFFIGGVPLEVYTKYRLFLSTGWNMTMCVKNATYADIPLITVMPKSLSTRFGNYQASSLLYGFSQLLSTTDRAAFSYNCPPRSPCSTSPDLAVCQNGGTCMPQWLDAYSCSCPVGYKGEYCQLLDSACSPTPCSPGSGCSDLVGGSFRCECSPGRTGERCDQVAATTALPFFSTNVCMKAKPCENNGRCFAVADGAQGGYRCLCDRTGFGGRNCTVPLSRTCTANSEDPCLNGGVCINATNSRDSDRANFSCSCKNGFYGLVCEFAVDWCADNRCSNNAKCVPQPQDQTYSCVCPPGFSGSLCETKTDYCASHPCLNQGHCTGTKVGYNCSCVDGFYGANCQLRDASICESKPCKRGKCVELPAPDSYKCDCSNEPGYDTVSCENIDECTVLQPCGNGGTCVDVDGDYSCDCTLGFGGKNCTAVNCTAVDCNSGQCQSTPDGSKWECRCNDYYHGTFCQSGSKCASLPCNNGTCIEDPADLFNNYSCHCNEGWLNRNCSIYNCSLETSFCWNGGSCRMISDGEMWMPQCECPTGWSSATLCAEELRAELPAEWIYAPIVAVVAAAILICAVLLALRIKQKRATGGNYSPSRQEAIGTRVELEDIIKPPPEERLI